MDFDVDALVARWNRATKLEHPTVRDLVVAVGSNAVVPVYSNVREFGYLGNNLWLRTAPGAAICPTAPVQALCCAMVSWYFSPASLVSTADVPGLVLGGIHLSGRAASDFAEDLRRLGENVILTSEMSKYVLWWGAISVGFREKGAEFVGSPHSAVVSGLSFAYAPRKLSPLLTRAN